MQIGLPKGEAADADLQRFQAALSKLLGKTDPPAKILLAVSGGPDSLALLILAARTLPGQIEAATVDHRLRPESRAEADYVAAICASLDITHHILTPAQPITGSMQAAARETRYALLTECARQQGCDWIATAHHADDQLETLLMRLARGSGANGLSGVRARQGMVIRPLLDFTKAELKAICASAEIEPVFDPSKANTDYDRVVIRNWLANGHPLDASRAVRSAAALADAAEALDWMTDQFVRERITVKQSEIEIDLNALPKELKRRLLLLALSMAEPDLTPRGSALDRCLDAIMREDTMMLGNQLISGKNGTCLVRPAPPRKN